MAGRGAVVITGASTGIGEASAVHLANLGFRVFAGVRKDQDAARLAARHRAITPIKLEVTDAGHIAAAADSVQAALGGERLAGLVNNAGIAVGSPLEFIPIDELRRQFDINTIAPVAVTQVFLPMLRESRGRVVHVSSAGGLLSNPFAGAYSASKFALEALADAMRIELRPWGIHVILIEPGSIATPIWERGQALADQLLERMPARAIELYGPQIERARHIADLAAKRGRPPEAAAKAIGKAFTEPNPAPRYLVGADARAQATIARLLPTRLKDRLITRVLRT